MRRWFETRSVAGPLVAAVALWAAFVAGAAGCSPAIGVDVNVDGAHLIDGDQIEITGGLVGSDGQTVPMMHLALLPGRPRQLAPTEDARILFPVEDGGRVVRLDVQVRKGGQPVGAPQTGMALLSLTITKRVCFCFDPSGLCPTSPCRTN